MNDDARRSEQERDIVDAWREAIARDPDEHPSRAADALIHAAARSAAATSTRRHRSWRVPLALAASVVLAVGLGLRQHAGAPPTADRDEARTTSQAKEAAAEAPAATAPVAGAPAAQFAPPAAHEQPLARPSTRRELTPEASPTAPRRLATPALGDAVPDAAAPAAQAGRLGQDPVARIQRLIETGDREAAIALARAHLARFGPDSLPSALKRELDLTSP